MKNLTQEQEDFESVLICAIRYCLGRRTYMPHIVIQFVEERIDTLSQQTITCIIRDIENFNHGGLIGDPDIDDPAWKSFLYKLKNEQQERTRNGR